MSANSCCANMLVQNLLTGDLQLYFSTGGNCANTAKHTKLMLSLWIIHWIMICCRIRETGLEMRKSRGWLDKDNGLTIKLRDGDQGEDGSDRFTITDTKVIMGGKKQVIQVKMIAERKLFRLETRQGPRFVHHEHHGDDGGVETGNTGWRSLTGQAWRCGWWGGRWDREYRLTVIDTTELEMWVTRGEMWQGIQVGDHWHDRPGDVGDEGGDETGNTGWRSLTRQA